MLFGCNNCNEVCYIANVAPICKANCKQCWLCCAGSDSGSSHGLRSAPVSFIRSKSQRPLRQVDAEAAERDAVAALARKPAAGAGCEADTGARTLSLSSVPVLLSSGLG